MRNSGAHYILQRCFKDDDTNKIFIDIEKSVWIHPWIQFTWVVWLLKSTNNYPENTQRLKNHSVFELSPTINISRTPHLSDLIFRIHSNNKTIKIARCNENNQIMSKIMMKLFSFLTLFNVAPSGKKYAQID